MKRLSNFYVCSFIALLAGLVLLLPGAAQGRVYAAPAMDVGYDADHVLGQVALPKWWVDTAEGAANADDRARLAYALASEQDRSTAVSVAGIVSDDFNMCSLDTGLWTFIDPLTDATHSMVGTFTANAWLSITVPAGTSHDIWSSGNFAPRIMQPANDTDFEIEVKFESGLSKAYQMQGVLVEQDSDDLLRLEFYSDGSWTRLFAAVLEPGSSDPLKPTVQYNQAITGTNEAPLYMRVRRQGDQWTQSYSFDGTSWVTPVTFTHAMTVTAVGPYASSAGSSPPAHTGTIDYFFNTAAPVVSEDGYRNVLTVHTVGSGSVITEPAQSTYSCGQVVTLTAAADPGWAFTGWSGDLVDTDRSVTVTMTGSRVITATFAQDEYTLAVRTVGSGSVITEPVKSSYYYGDVVTFTAIPAMGWTFADWSGALSGIDNPASKTITGNTTITATFTQDEYVLTVNTVGSGSVITEPVKTTYRYGDVVTLTATADPGWTFAGWSGALSGTDNPAVKTITGNAAVTATFTQDEYTLAVNWTGEGRVDKDPDQPTYHYGDVVTLTATADPGWTFAGWSGALSGTDNPVTKTITGNTAVTATFTQDEYTLAVDWVGEGRVNRDPDQATYHYGEVVTLTATADPGWTFAGWSGALSGIDNPAIKTITGNTAVTATFTQDEYTVTVNTVGSGSVITEPVKPAYHYGDMVTFTAHADPGWTFAGWSGALSVTDNPATKTITGNTAVTATFTQDEYTLMVNQIGRGRVDRDPDQATYHYGEVVTLTATADPGWTFAGWSGNLGADNPVAVTMTGDITVTATFAAEYEYTLAINIIGEGKVARDPEQLTYYPGDVVTLTATAEPGWIFAGWSGALAGTKNPDAVTINGNKIVTTTFTSHQIFLPLITAQYSSELGSQSTARSPTCMVGSVASNDPGTGSAGTCSGRAVIGPLRRHGRPSTVVS